MKTVNIDELRGLLHEQKTHFEYQKVDGSIRKAYGTLKFDFIPEVMQPKDGSTYVSNNLKYFDLDKKEWRSLAGSIKEVNIVEE